MVNDETELFPGGVAATLNNANGNGGDKQCFAVRDEEVENQRT